MLARFRSRLTFANVVSPMALFVALGGGAHAMTIPQDSVVATQLNKNAVTDRSGDSWRRGKDRCDVGVLDLYACCPMSDL